MTDLPPLQPRRTPGAQVESIAPGAWRLSLPPGPAGQYRWAQLDDYLHLPRRSFSWRAPLRLKLRARASGADLPGTWGFGFWNDPFSAGLGLGGTARRLPTLPDAAWFFFASPPNHLAVHDDHPAQGFLAATFASRPLPWPMLAAGAPLIPLLGWPPTARWLRARLRRYVRESAARLALDPTEWHAYSLDCRPGHVGFAVDDAVVFETAAAPRARLGLVLWIDNQYAAFPPDGRLRFGTLAGPAAAWLDLADLSVEAG